MIMHLFSILLSSRIGGGLPALYGSGQVIQTSRGQTNTTPV